LNGIKNLEYPKKKIHLAFLVNNPDYIKTNEVLDMLLKFKEAHKDKYYKIDIWDATGNWNDERVHERFFSYFAAIRNKWLEMLDENDTHIFSVDSDILILPNTLRRLLDWNKDIISAVIYNGKDSEGRDTFNFMSKTSDRFPNGDSVYIHRHPTYLESRAQWEQDEKTRLWKMADPPEVKMTGAISLIKREVIDAGTRYGFAAQGEDIYFSEKAIENGFKIYCDFTIQPAHIRDPMELHSIINIPQGMVVKPPYVDRAAPEPHVEPEVEIIGEY
jgi:hypothetical protein